MQDYDLVHCGIENKVYEDLIWDVEDKIYARKTVKKNIVRNIISSVSMQQ